MTGLTDEELFGAPRAAVAPVAPARAAPARDPVDYAIRTVYGEADASDTGSRQAVAAVIRNRAKQRGKAYDEVVLEPNQFEPWSDPKARKRMLDLSPESAEYKAIAADIAPVLSGEIALPYDHFYSPGVLQQRGQGTPDWASGEGTKVGSQLFYALGGGAPIMSTDDQKAWEELYGADRPVKIAPTKGTPNPGKPDSRQAETAKWLQLHGFFNTDATAGSAQLPLMETAQSGAPTEKGAWYIPRGGGLRQVGSEVPDFLPQYQELVGLQKAEMEKPLLGRVGKGFFQGASDVAASVNKLTGGGLAATALDPMATGLMEVPAYDLGREAQLGFEQQRNEYNLRHGPDLSMTAARLGGNLAASLPFMAGAEGALGALGAGAVRAAPASAPVVDFLAGGAGGSNLLIRAPSKAAQGAAQGAEMTLLNSSQSDVPLGEQLRHGAEVGAFAGGAIPLASGTMNRLVGGAERASPAVSDLAGLATNKYGIPLRTGQIKGVTDRAAAVRDSEMIGQPGTGFAENQAAQRRAFTRAVAGTFGEEAEALTPQVMQRAKARIGGDFDQVAAATTIRDTNSLKSNLQTVVDEAGQVLPEGEVAPIAKQVEAINSAMKDGALSGETYQALTRKGSPLDRATESSNPNIRFYAQRLRETLDDALEASATPENAEMLSRARWQYKNLMTLKNLAAKANVEGEISPALLSGAVNTSFKNRAFAGAGDLGELAQIGQTFMKEPPNSGTVPRLMDAIKRNALSLGGLGGAGAAAAFQNPELALKLGAASAGLGALRYGSDAFSGAVARNPLIVGNLIRRGQQAADLERPLLTAPTSVNYLLGHTFVPTAVLAERNRLFRLPAPETAP